MKTATTGWSWFRRGACVALSVFGWSTLVVFALLAAWVLWWVALAAVLLHSRPGTDEPVIAIAFVLLAITGALAWLVARFLASARSVGLALAVIVALATVGGTGFGLVFPDRTLALARQMAWGESDIKDYLRFPERAVGNAAPVFNFKKDLSPELFSTIEYRSGGEVKQADFEAFMEMTKTTSFIVIKDDAILCEGYFNGYDRDSIVTSFSIAKSFTSALVGIAIDEGLIASVNDPVTKYLPELKGRGLDGLTIRHLLMMSSGTQYVTDDEAPIFAQLTGFTDDALSYYYPDLRGRALGVRPDGTRPGTYFNYNNHYPQLLGIVLERVTGQRPAVYLQEKIWEPLGMEWPASWSLDSEEHGFEMMQSGINARAIDFAKFGRLFLENGNWNGNQIVSKGWVAESTSPDPDDTRPWRSDVGWEEANGYYKYLWWGMPNADGTYDYVAQGHLGQRIFVSPRKNAIVVRFGFTDEGVDNWAEVLAGVIAPL